MAKHNPASAADVRSWAVTKGLIPADAQTRGRLSKTVIEAFNKGRPSAAHYVVGHKPARTVTVEVPTTDSKGRNRTRKVSVSPAEARAHAVSAGVSVGKRGRLNAATMVAFAQSKV